MKKHLNQTMVEFIKEQNKPVGFSYLSFYENVEKYANALSQTPRLGHFIPCDHNDIPLQKPIEYSGMDSDALYDVEQYQLACDRVLFEGFFIDKLPNNSSRVKNMAFVCVFWYNLAKDKKWSLDMRIETYENLVKYNLPITDNGAKFFGL